MAKRSKERAAAFGWQEGQRQPVPASLAQLLQALKRLWAEAAALAENAYLAIQHHSYEPYWTFRAKIEEHAALVAVLRGRLARLREMRSPAADTVAATVDREESEILILTVKACLKFCFALSANPWLPIGARETFIHETGTLQQARGILAQSPKEKLPEGLLDEIDMAQMILEEIIEKSPSLTNFERHPAAEPAPEPVEEPPVFAAAHPAESPDLMPA